MRRLLLCLLLLATACEFQIDNATETTGAPPEGPRFEAPPAGGFTVRPLPGDEGGDGAPGREAIQAVLESVAGGHWEYLALQYVVSEPRRLRVELGERVAVDASPTWAEGSGWLAGLSDEVPAGRPVTVVAAHRAAEGGRRVRLYIFGGAGRGRAGRGEAVAVAKPAAGVMVETIVSGEAVPPTAGTFFDMIVPDIPSGFLTGHDFSPFPLGVWAHVPVTGGSSTSFRNVNGVKSVSFSSGDVSIEGNGVDWTISVAGKPVDVVDYPHVAWVFRGVFDPVAETGE